ncbi:MAG: methyltransferase domain-containing protein [Propionibacteriaceae bacterium]|nr:methyltransferase domain-containing protein [Propionibacteriaceae bacterium]
MATYIRGHHASVVASHGARTMADSAAYLAPQLRPGMSVLDVGCGPGSITLDLAAAVAGEGARVVGVENTSAPLELARRNAAQRGDTLVEWELADAYGLPFEDGTFDVAHAHQVLQHLADPVAALREMARVTRPGGLVAARDADYGGMIWYPPLPGLTRWLDVYRQTARANNGEPDAARHMLAWAHAAGLTDVQVSTSTWHYSGDEGRAFWGGQWQKRALESAFATQSVEAGVATPDELPGIAEAWREWSEDPDAWFAMLHTEILARI